MDKAQSAPPEATGHPLLLLLLVVICALRDGARGSNICYCNGCNGIPTSPLLAEWQWWRIAYSLLVVVIVVVVVVVIVVVVVVSCGSKSGSRRSSSISSNEIIMVLMDVQTTQMITHTHTPILMNRQTCNTQTRQRNHDQRNDPAH